MKTKRTSFLARTAMTLLFTVLTTVTTWADSWPEYITDVILVGKDYGSDMSSLMNAHSDYTFIQTSLNAGSTKGDIIYVGYKKGSRDNVNGGYITDIIVVDAEGHNPPSTVTCDGHTYYLCPYDGDSDFVSDKGNLTYKCGRGWNMYLYYTKENFSDKRAVSGITITTGSSESSASRSGSINCYYKNGNLHEKEIDFNKGVGCGTYVYMHLSTTTKTNRPSADPVMASGLTYNGSAKQLVATNATLAYGSMYYRVGTSGNWTSTVTDVKATAAGNYTVQYYAGSNSYSNQSDTHSKTVTIAKSPNNGVTVTCSNYLEGTTPVPSLVGTNLSSGTVTYKYNKSQNGEYTTTVPTEPGTYWVKATIAADNNCFEYTTAPVSFTITYNWKLHNSGDTEDDAYVISTIADLKYLAVWVNLGNNFEGKFFKLGANITLDKSKENNFTPIGNANYSFSGTFDGQGYTISGLNINKTNNDNVGLFGYADGATIKNLKLTNSTITGKSNVGAIVGCGSGNNTTTVENCLVTSDVTVSGQSYNVGGIVGSIATIRGCVSAATVSGSGGEIGGIIGNGNLSTVTNCLYTGNSVSGTSYVGAIVGNRGSATLNHNYYTQATIGGSGADQGDAIGARKAVAINTADAVTVTPTGTATAYNVSGITGYADNNGIGYGGHLYAGATETVSLDITYGIDGFSVTGYTDGNDNALTLVSDNTYTLTMTADAPTVTPVGNDLWGVTTAGRDGSTADKAYIITTTEGLDLLASKVNSGTNYAGKYFELGNDIDYSEVPLTLDDGKSNYTAIGYNYAYNNQSLFSGHFDGKGHTISGIVINKAADYQGLFSGIDGAEVKNLTITDATITVGSNNGTVGAIAGYSQNSAVIENCHVTSSVTVTALTGGSYGTYVGGIVGESIITTVRGCTSAATVSGNYSVGAIAGSDNKATIENCLVLGATISGNKYAGAIVGYIKSSTHTNNLYIGTNVGGVGSAGDATGTDITGATIAYEFPTAISAMGAKGTTYAAGTDYEGVTAYANGLAYNGKYYYPSLWTGDGTSDNPYIIYTTAGLDKLASDVNAGNNYEGTYFALGNDITYSYAGLAEGESNYTAIGKYNGSNNIMTFSGIFDGKGHTISGIRITKDGGGFKYSYQGVFGYIRNATVKNVKLTDTRITAADHIGGIAGFNSASTIENCHVTNTVTIQSNGNSEFYLGGIAGELHDYNGVDPCVRGCTSAATVSGDTEVGGIVGKLYDGSIIDCLYLGTSVTGTYLIGAIVGNNVNNTLSNNYYTTYGLGGIGSDTGATGSDVAGACFAYEYPAATGAMGAVVSTYGTGDYTGMTVYTDGLAYKGKYYCPLPWTGDGTAEHPFVISTTDGLDKLAIKVNAGTSYSGKYFELGNDITYSYDGLAEGESNFTTIGENGYWFSGTFDGKGHTISGIRISDTYGIYKAIFGRVNGTVKNLVVSDCSMEASHWIGGIVAQLYSGTIENCHVLSDVTLTGYMYIGGITADIYGGTIKGCTSAARITGTKSGDNNARYLGGIAGLAFKYGEHSPTLTDNLFTGTISGDLDERIGAIVGGNDSDETTLTNNYHTCSGMGGVGREGLAIGYDLDGVTSAYELAAANAAMGAVGSTYGTGDYTGITAYENGLAYKGKFYSPSPWGGSGTEADPYVIYNTQGMDLLATNVNGGNDYQDTYFVLGNDIVYAPDVLTLDLDGDGNNDSNYMPVGNNGSPFMGNFDGQGHTISGISVNANEMYYIGVFGVNDGTVKNLTVSDCLFAGSETIGAIAGFNWGTVENCHVAAGVSVTGNNGVGGVVGNNEGSVLGCTSAATLSAKEYARYFGGIAGNNSGTLTDNLFTGTIDKMPDGSWGIGAITGYNNTELGGTLTNNFHTCSGMGGVGNDNDATNTDQDGAQIAVARSTQPDASIIGEEKKTYGGTQYTGITAYEHGLYYNGKYYYFSLWAGSGTEDDPYIIINTAGLDKLASDVSGGNRYKGTYFELGADITYDGSENNFTPIGEDGYWFYGTFDGKGHTVSGIRISDTNGIFKAIFGYVCGTIKNLVVSDCSIEARQGIGGIVGYLFGGTIENCHVDSEVTLTGNRYIGGIAASLEGGTVIGCTSAATITGTTVGGGKAYFLGGISGNASGNVEDSPTLTDNLFTGTISGDLYDYIGAIVGKNNSTGTTLTNNYHTCSGLGGVGDDGIVIGSDEDGKAEFAVSSTTEPDEATIGTAGTPYAAGETYQGITPYTKGLFYNGLYYYKDPNTVAWTGKGTETDPYVIRTTAELDLLASRVNSGNNYRGKYFELGADITYDGSENNFTPIGENGYSFYGTFDGKGHTISGIRISDKDGTHKAIFGRIGGTVKNLVVSDCSIEGNIYVGGIVGLLYGTIENCHVGSNVTLTGYMLIGGIAGDLEGGTIIGCTSAARITGTKDGGSNARYLGGIAGLAFIYGEHSPTLTDNLFTGTISGDLDESIGAIVGGNDSDETTLTNNYHTCSGIGGVGSEGTATGSDEDGALLAVSSTTKPDEATIGTAGTPYAEDKTYQGITPYSKGLYYDGRYYWHEAFLRGDANGDGQVTITDAVAVVNYILGNPSENFNKAAANVNGDTDEHGEPIISITDAVGVVNIILNGAASTPAFTAPALTAPEDDDASPVDPE